MESFFLVPGEALRSAGLAEGMKVADLGCGGGFFARAAARAVAPAEVWAVDPNREILSRVKNLALGEGLHNVEVLSGTPQASNLPAGRFDVVIVANTLFAEAPEERGAVAGEAHRLLRRGGKVVVIDWSGSHGGLGPHPNHIVEEKVARALFERAGFGWERALPAGSYHWGALFKKGGHSIKKVQ
ncbi:MAG: class I SAM-dependent methyltransferase [Patescibacteria group bacterium]|nr:class I SAM-dependent methyltransferase [Patescibacteria group bacterium]